MVPVRTIILASLFALTAFSGCITTDSPSDLDAALDADAAPVARWVTEELSGDINIATATPAISVNNGGAYQFPLDRSDANATGWVLELEWDAVDARSQSLDLWIREICDCTIPASEPTETGQVPDPVAKATGPSVLRLTATPDLFEDDKDYEILVRAASPAGVSQAQPFTLHLSRASGVDFDSEYSALA